MVFGLKALRGGSGNTLVVDLERATESGVIDVPKELISKVVDASQHEDDRKKIMQHVYSCLAEPSGKRWRRVNAGLLLVESLAYEGSQELILEASEGLHFDVVQRLSFLERFECSIDKRAERIVRTKAISLRSLWIRRVQDVTELTPLSVKDTVSIYSPGCDSIASQSTAASMDDTSPIDKADTSPDLAPTGEEVGNASDAKQNNIESKGSTWMFWRRSHNKEPEPTIEDRLEHGVDLDSLEANIAGKLGGILNGVAFIGHSDDTTSESSGNEMPRNGVRLPEQRRKTRRERCRHHGTSQDVAALPKQDQAKYAPGDICKYAATTPAASATDTSSVDLLGL